MNQQDIYNTASTAYYIHKYRNVRIQITKTSLNIAYNKTCRKHNIIPTHAQIIIKNNTHAAIQTKHKVEILHLDNIVKDVYHKKDTLNKTAYNLHVKLTQILHHIELEHIIQYTRNIIEKIQLRTQERHNRKINNLLTRRNENILTPTHKFHARTVNTTLTHFTNAEITLLDKGLKHNLDIIPTNNNSNKKHTRDIVLDAETAIQHTHNIDPVSYTHLDVYKRQVIILVRCMISFMCV